jgi:hypothetical protein
MELKQIELICAVKKADAWLSWCELALSSGVNGPNGIQREGILDKAAARVVLDIEHPFVCESTVGARAIDGRSKGVPVWGDIVG